LPDSDPGWLKNLNPNPRPPGPPRKPTHPVSGFTRSVSRQRCAQACPDTVANPASISYRQAPPLGPVQWTWEVPVTLRAKEGNQSLNAWPTLLQLPNIPRGDWFCAQCKGGIHRGGQHKQRAAVSGRLPSGESDADYVRNLTAPEPCQALPACRHLASARCTDACSLNPTGAVKRKA
jgi:hypothetical protein